VEHLDRLARATGALSMDGAFHDADGKLRRPGIAARLEGIGLAARRSLLALRLIAGSERIVGNPSLIGKVRLARHSRVIQSRILQSESNTFHMPTNRY